MWGKIGLYYCVGQAEKSLIADSMSEDIENEMKNRHISSSPIQLKMIMGTPGLFLIGVVGEEKQYGRGNSVGRNCE